MDHPDFLSAVSQRSALDRDQADAVSKATLQTLAEQVPPAAMDDLLASLPNELGQITVPTQPDGQEQRLPLDEFCQVISDRAALDDSSYARAHVHSVFAVLADAAGAERLRTAVAGLRPEYQALLPGDTGGADEFAARVANHARLSSRQEATASSHAVLAALAERLSEGQARELAPGLPPELRPYLHPEKGNAQPFDKPDFLSQVGSEAGLAGTDAAEAHARAVLTTIAEWVERDELDDTLAQLPPELADMFT